jgi:3-methyladenine DNA glycosylase/8-oxoguanine DNA glycosylase
VSAPDAELLVAGTQGVELVASLRPLADGRSDPTWRFGSDRAVRAMTTPEGPVTVELTSLPDGIRARCWGPGSEWLVPRIHRLVGTATPEDFRADLHPVVHAAHRRSSGLRFAAGLRLADVVVPTILGQRVTSQEARHSWWTLVRRTGVAAPGPHDLQLPPDPAVVARLSDADWHRLGVERQRADAIRRVLGVLHGLEAAAERDSMELQHLLCTVPGIGPWTATGLAQHVLGDPDAVLLGDLHVPHNVCFALAGEERGSDERMLELLEPWRGQRARVVRLLARSGRRAPKRGPRYTPLPIARW